MRESQMILYIIIQVKTYFSLLVKMKHYLKNLKKSWVAVKLHAAMMAFKLKAATSEYTVVNIHCDSLSYILLYLPTKQREIFQNIFRKYEISASLSLCY